MPTTTSSSTTTTTSSTTTTTTSSTTTTTTAPPPPSVVSGGISAASDETVISGIVWTQPDPRQVCTDVSVTGISAQAYPWAIQVDLTVAPWYGASPQQVSVRGSGTTTTLSNTLVLITGRSNGGPWDPRTNNSPITNTQTAIVTICNQTPPAPRPAADTGWYTVTAAPQPATKSEACVILTAAPSGAESGTFFFGWTHTVDLRAAKAALSAAGGTPKKVTWSPQPNGTPNISVNPSDFNTALDEYTITSGYDYALRAGAAARRR